MDRNVAIDCILSGNAILITGSGANYGVKNHLGQSFPNGGDLAKYLYEKCGETPSTDLQDASELYLNNHSTSELVGELHSLLSAQEIPETQKHLYSHPWVRCYTTNYDNIPVIASRQAEITLIPKTLTDKYEPRYISDKKFCVYINGFIGNINETNVLTQLKLTNKSYLSSDYINESQWGALFKEDLDYAKCIIILGLSLDYDLDLSKLLYGDGLKEKIYIVTSPSASSTEVRKLSRFGEVDCCGVVTFCEEISIRNATFEPPLPDDIVYTCFETNTYGIKRTESISDKAVFNFYMNGIFDASMLTLNKGQYKALIDRSEIRTILNAINTNIRAIFIHSAFGNGKTTIKNILKHKLGRQGAVKVYELTNEYAQRITKEVVQLCSSNKKTVIIVEDFFNHVGLFHKFKNHSTDNLVFILTARTAIMESRQGVIIDALDMKAQDIMTINVDELSNDEMFDCVDIFSEYGLWGEHNALSRSEKKGLLTKRRKGNKKFQSIMSVVVKSTHMHKRIQSIIDVIKKDANEYYPAIILILLRRVMTLDISLLDIGRITKVDIFSYKFKNNAAVRELIDFSSGSARTVIESSIILKLILSSIENIDIVIRSLLFIAAYASKYSETDKFFTLLKGITSYTHINYIISSYDSDEPKKHFINRYYEELKVLPYYRTSNFFWLQYAISCIALGEYDRAQTYLSNAYGFSTRENSDFDPFQIDNQQARLYLEKIKSGVSSDPLDDFNKAHTILMKPVSSKQNDERNIIRLFDSYIDSRVMHILTDIDKENYCVKCSEAYNRSLAYSKKISDKSAFVNTRNKLLQYAVLP